MSPGRFPTLLLALLVTGCASAPVQRGDPFGRTPGFAEEGVLLTVENHDYRDATVYAYWNGVRDRVGMVIGKTTKTFEMEWKSEELQLRIDFVGGRDEHWSERVAVYDGDHINYIIRISGT